MATLHSKVSKQSAVGNHNGYALLLYDCCRRIKKLLELDMDQSEKIIVGVVGFNEGQGKRLFC